MKSHYKKIVPGRYIAHNDIHFTVVYDMGRTGINQPSSGAQNVRERNPTYSPAREINRLGAEEAKTDTRLDPRFVHLFLFLRLSFAVAIILIHVVPIATVALSRAATHSSFPEERLEYRVDDRVFAEPAETNARTISIVG